MTGKPVMNWLFPKLNTIADDEPADPDIPIVEPVAEGHNIVPAADWKQLVLTDEEDGTEARHCVEPCANLCAEQLPLCVECWKRVPSKSAMEYIVDIETAYVAVDPAKRIREARARVILAFRGVT